MLRLIAFPALILFALGAVVLTAEAQAPADTDAVQAPADTAAAPAPADTAATPPSQPTNPKPPAVLYEKAKLVVDGKAEADGSISFLFVPEGGKAATLSVNVLKETEKKDIAKAIYTQFAIAAGKQYKVKVSGQEVKIEKAKKENPRFSVTVEAIALPGVSILVKKD
jgi:hypothetical protein